MAESNSLFIPSTGTSLTTGTITGATGTSATATIPAGKTNCVISMRNETHPTAPYTTDAVIIVPVWNISGTTLTVYFKATTGSLTDSYTISYIVW